MSTDPLEFFSSEARSILTDLRKSLKDTGAPYAVKIGDTPYVNASVLWLMYSTFRDNAVFVSNAEVPIDSVEAFALAAILASEAAGAVLDELGLGTSVEDVNNED